MRPGLPESKRAFPLWGGLALAIVAFLVASGRAVSAHSLLDHADPPVGAKLATSPGKLSLYFTGGLVTDSSWVLLRDSNDNDIPVTLSFDPGEHPKAMYAAVPLLQPGVYTVKWQTLSSDDDDYVQDSFQITVLNGDGSAPPGSSQAAPALAPSAATNKAQNQKKSSGSGLGLALALLAGSAVVVGLAGFGMRLQRSRR